MSNSNQMFVEGFKDVCSSYVEANKSCMQINIALFSGFFYFIYNNIVSKQDKFNLYLSFFILYFFLAIFYLCYILIIFPEKH